jgi:hypothetical protein
MNGISQLKQLALADSRKHFPTLPEEARCTRSYSDRTANGLTKCIIDFLRFNSWQAERINCTGKPVDQTKIVTDVLGDQRRIGSVKWLPTSGEKGTADTSATICGRSVKIEVKIRDRQSADQKKYQEKIEKAGGLYWLVRSFEEFLNFYNQLINYENEKLHTR